MGDDYFLDQADCGFYIIRKNTERYNAGYDKEKVKNIIARLNMSYRPSIEVKDNNLYICWNNHGKGQKCEWEKEIEKCV